MLTLLSVYTDPNVVQAWRGAVKCLGQKQGPALEEALRLWLRTHAAEVTKAIRPTETVALPSPRVVKVA